MQTHVAIAIIGAGPYGLSLAAHLAKQKADFCIIGAPMGTWRTGMPAGMSLKSEGFASNLSDPDGRFPLKTFCAENRLPYADIGVPVRLSTFAAYGLAFQRRFVPDLIETLVTRLTREGSGFRLELENGDIVLARRVVVAAGIAQFARLPEELADLPGEFVSHSSQHHAMDRFNGSEVVVLGGGSSAIDVALSLHDAGARAQLVTRGRAVHFHGKSPDKRSLRTRLSSPWSGLGPGWYSRLACDLPTVFHLMPREFRLRIVRKHLGPAPGWFTRDRMVNSVPMHADLRLTSAAVTGDKVHLQFRNPEGATREIVADHVIAGTGYRVDLRRLPFLDESLCREIATEGGSPRLSTCFESSVSGLYFVGTCAAASFGPLLRFAFGARFAARRLTWHLAGGLRPRWKRDRKSFRTPGRLPSPAASLASLHANSQPLLGESPEGTGDALG